MDRQQVIPRYMKNDGKYFGILTNTPIKEGTLTRFPFKDNGLEHLLDGKIVSCGQTKEGLYSCLVELDPPAPQRVIDLYCFAPEYDLGVGEVRKDQLKIYSDCVFIVGMKFNVTYLIESLNAKIPIKGEVVLEDTQLDLHGFKYVFWIKLDEELSDKDYETLKKTDMDDIGNYF